MHWLPDALADSASDLTKGILLRIKRQQRLEFFFCIEEDLGGGEKHLGKHYPTLQ